MAFSWKHHSEIREKKLLFRMKSLARSNPDFKIAHPELVKELLNDGMANKVETKKFIRSKNERADKYGKVPKPSVIIKRFNRV